MEFNFNRNTIILLVGPSNCGKSTLASKICGRLYSKGYYVSILSSDECRRHLLCAPWLEKYDERMMQASEKAFKLLEEELDYRTSYPINNDFIIVDSTGLDPKFRRKILDIAKSNHYKVDVVVFEFNNKEEYYTGLQLPHHTSIVRKHVRKLLKEGVQDLRNRDFNNKFRIRSREDIGNVTVTINEEEGKYLEVNNNNYLIVGDIHNCYNELIQLLQNRKCIIENNEIKECPYEEIICLGDLIDKGPELRKTIEFIHKNISWILPIKGNHENFVYKYLKGDLKKDIIAAETLEYFDSIPVLEKDDELRQKFFDIVEQSYDFIKGPNWIVTHSPCKNIYLGKTDRISLKHQRNFRHAGFTPEQIKERIKFLDDEQNRCHPIHIHGHIALKRPFKNRSNIGLDGGCYLGGKLHAVSPNTFRITSVDSQQPDHCDELLDLSFEKVKTFNLSSRDERKINYFVKDKINFLSGTMCPADKCEPELECLEWAMDYYKKAGAIHVFLQKKMMGSRLNVYLFENVEDCYSITRNGFKIDHLDLTSEYERLIEKFKLDFSDGLHLRILDCELMPWRALGSELIDKEFYGLYELTKTEIEECKDEFYRCLEQIKESLDGQAFKELNKKEFIKQKGHHIYHTHKGYYDAAANIYDSAEEELADLERFKSVVDIYGGNGPLKIEPFSILKDVDKEGKEKYYNQSTMWARINEDKSGCILIKIDDIESARDFFNEQTIDRSEEGIVIKPANPIDGAAPYIKVRNPEYLRIIYGYDYLQPNKYKKLCQRKRVDRKLRISIKEFKLAEEMLKIRYDELSKDNNKLVQLYSEFLGEEERCKDVDPRL